MEEAAQLASEPPARAQHSDVELFLPAHVFVCITEGHGVFLDLANDRYSAVLLPRTDEGAAPRPLHELLAPQCAPLLESGLLTRRSADAKPIAATSAQGIKGHIFGLDDQRAFGLTGEAARGLRIGPAELLDFFLASWQAARALKAQHIAWTVATVARRKDRARARRTDHATVKRLTAIYARLRPWYPRKYLCLYDSLALVHFLARRDVFPLWVFAVQAQPFGAHCWVQWEGLLLNEGSEYAGQFTPILTI